MRRRILIVAALAVAMLVAFAADLVTGPSSLSPLDAVSGLFAPDSLSGPMRVIIWDVRLPQALLAILAARPCRSPARKCRPCSTTRSPAPLTLGVSSAASLGAALAIVLGIGVPGLSMSWIVSVNAFVFAFGSVLLLQALSRLRGTVGDAGPHRDRAGFTCNALVALIQFIASQEALQQRLWSMGSLSRGNWTSSACLRSFCWR